MLAILMYHTHTRIHKKRKIRNEGNYEGNGRTEKLAIVLLFTYIFLLVHSSLDFLYSMEQLTLWNYELIDIDRFSIPICQIHCVVLWS